VPKTICGLAYKDGGLGDAPLIAKTLREVANFGFMQRERVRFVAGHSELLGVTFAPNPRDGFLVDVRASRNLGASPSRPTAPRRPARS
jgi:hypothetical protein